MSYIGLKMYIYLRYFVFLSQTGYKRKQQQILIARLAYLVVLSEVSAFVITIHDLF